MLQTVANIQPRAEDAGKVMRVEVYDRALPVGRHVAPIKVADVSRPLAAAISAKPAVPRKAFNPATDKLRLVSSDGDQQ
jgi:hypothetical protein